MMPKMEEDNPSIVVLGGFDPRLLHPQWFRAEGLLGKTEAERADVKLVHPGLTEWSTDSLVVQVAHERLYVRAMVESASDALRDLVLGTLQILGHTHTTALGLNRSMHFDVGGEGNWHRIGHRLAPKELWLPHLKEEPGLRALQIEEGVRRDGLPGKTIVSVQPSQKYPHAVYFDVNNEIRNADDAPGTALFAQMISEHWKRLFDEARAMAEAVLTGAMR